MASEKISLTLEEIISTLQHSSLPTVITEGKDDIIVYRKLEDAFLDINISVLAVNGRSCLLELFKRRYEIRSPNKLAFIADRDHWIFTGIPTAYKANNLFFTHGYSVEMMFSSILKLNS